MIEYIITAKHNPSNIYYYFHGNDRKGKPMLYVFICDMPSCYLRVYKSKKTAERIARQIQAKIGINYKVCVEEL